MAKCVNISETGRKGEEVKGRMCKGCDTRVGRKEREKGKETVIFLLMPWTMQGWNMWH